MKAHATSYALLIPFGLIALLAAVAVPLRDSRYFGALFSASAALALTPVVAVVVLSAANVIRGRKLALASMGVYLIALLTPAIHLDGDIAYGWRATLLSVFGMTLFGEMRGQGEGLWYPIACALGLAANASYLLGYAALCVPVWRRRRPRLPLRAGAFSAVSAVAVIIPLALSRDLNGIYVGHGLWLATFLALELGAQEAPWPQRAINPTGLTPMH